jgi:phosphoribosyl-dephospho-CoA transferase
MTQQLAYHKLRAEEAKRTLAQESVGAYMEFANSLISMTRMAPGGVKRAEKRSR